MAVLKSKQPRPAEREAFLLEELEKANNDLLCKWPQAPESFALLVSLVVSSFLCMQVYNRTLKLRPVGWRVDFAMLPRLSGVTPPRFGQTPHEVGCWLFSKIA